jgi:hypothetical protein
MLTGGVKDTESWVRGVISKRKNILPNQAEGINCITNTINRA